MLGVPAENPALVVIALGGCAAPVDTMLAHDYATNTLTVTLQDALATTFVVDKAPTVITPTESPRVLLGDGVPS